MRIFFKVLNSPSGGGTMNTLIKWIKEWFKSMVDALFNPFTDNEPPEIGAQPFTGKINRRSRISI